MGLAARGTGLTQLLEAFVLAVLEGSLSRANASCHSVSAQPLNEAHAFLPEATSPTLQQSSQPGLWRSWGTWAPGQTLNFLLKTLRVEGSEDVGHVFPHCRLTKRPISPGLGQYSFQSRKTQLGIEPSGKSQLDG